MQDKTKQFTQAFGRIVEKHRNKLNKSIYRISAESSIPKFSWLRIEKGYNDTQLTSFWKVADGLEIEPFVLVKELQEELGEDFCLGEE